MNSRSAETNKSFGRRTDRPQIIIAKGDSVRSFTLNPLVLAITVSAFVFLGVIYLGATTYLFFRDDLIGATMARQARMQHAYEDRIASLRSEIDRITSRQLLDQEAFEIKLDQLMAHQDTLQGRQRRVSELLEQARKTGIRLAATAVPAAKPTPAGTPQIDETTGGVGGTLENVKPTKSSSFGADLFSGPVKRMAADQTESTIGRELTDVETRLQTMVREQGAALDAISIVTEENVGRIEKVLRGLGVKLASSSTPRPDNAATGGPFVPLSPSVFEDRLDRASRALKRFNDLKHSANALPLHTPVRNSKVSSRYGPRMDPFLQRPAMHTGIDFRGTRKTPVLATAKGRVKSAGRNGGYGRAVEIDHGNGLVTRYAHLSKILVKPGQLIHQGQIIGKIGSTGRSTGPHLHYETRLNGNAVNPIRYLRAGRKIAGLLK